MNAMSVAQVCLINFICLITKYSHVVGVCVQADDNNNESIADACAAMLPSLQHHNSWLTL